MIERKKILFFGDLAPEYLSGTSIAAKINLDILKESFTILHVEEGDNWLHHEKQHFSKVMKNIKHVNNILGLCKKEQPMLFYSHLPSSIFGLIKMILILQAVKWSCSAKIIMHLHRGDFNLKFNNSKLFQFLTKIINKKIDVLLALSIDHKNCLSSIFPLSKIRVLENTIEKEYNLTPNQSNKISFLYISNYILEKGILDLLEVFSELTKKHQNIELHTYGNAFDLSLLERIKEYDNNKNIFIHEKIEGEEKFQEISDKNCFILPSWNEGQPLVLLEAMSQGTNIIASDVGFVPEMLNFEYPYLFTGKDKKSLKAVIVNFIEDNNYDKNEVLRSRYIEIYSQMSHKNKLNKIFLNIV